MLPFNKYSKQRHKLTTDSHLNSALSCHHGDTLAWRHYRRSVRGVRFNYRESILKYSISIMAAGRLVLEGRISINAFILGLSVVVIPLIRFWFGHVDWVFDYLTETLGKIAICIHIAVINGLLLIIYRGPLYKVSFDDRLSKPIFICFLIFFEWNEEAKYCPAFKFISDNQELCHKLL